MSNLNMEKVDAVEIYEMESGEEHKWWRVYTYYVNIHCIKFVVPKGSITTLPHGDNWMVGSTDPIHDGTQSPRSPRAPP